MFQIGYYFNGRRVSLMKLWLNNLKLIGIDGSTRNIKKPTTVLICVPKGHHINLMNH